MPWLTIVTPLPSPPKSWDDLPHTGPYALLDDLLREFAGIADPKTQEEPENPVTGEVSGITGTPTAGYRWAEQRCPETSVIPAARQASTVGIEGLELIWHWAAPKMGQAGFAGFSHRNLWVRFDGPATRARFSALWAARFGGEPVYVEFKTPPRSQLSERGS